MRRGVLSAGTALVAALPDVLLVAAVALITVGAWQQLGRPAGLVVLGLACGLLSRALARSRA